MSNENESNGNESKENESKGNSSMQYIYPRPLRGQSAIKHALKKTKKSWDPVLLLEEAKSKTKEQLEKEYVEYKVRARYLAVVRHQHQRAMEEADAHAWYWFELSMQTYEKVVPMLDEIRTRITHMEQDLAAGIDTESSRELVKLRELKKYLKEEMVLEHSKLFDMKGSYFRKFKNPKDTWKMNFLPGEHSWMFLCQCGKYRWKGFSGCPNRNCVLNRYDDNGDIPYQLNIACSNIFRKN